MFFLFDYLWEIWTSTFIIYTLFHDLTTWNVYMGTNKHSEFKFGNVYAENI